MVADNVENQLRPAKGIRLLRIAVGVEERLVRKFLHRPWPNLYKFI